jgi:DNA-binding response OmpR family regulator
VNRLLLVEDEEHLAEGLAFNLRNAGYEVDRVGTGEEALEALVSADYDLVLLDLMLPGIGGLEVARRLRRDGDTRPILMITALHRAEDAIAGLDAGADDYIPKPFDLDEVLARIRCALRRQVWARASAPQGAPETLQYGDWKVEFDSYRAVADDGRQVDLTAKELAILRLFASRPESVISRGTFLEEVWGIPGTIETRAVDNFIRRLRRTLERDPARPRHIVSVRGAGYRFVP